MHSLCREGGVGDGGEGFSDIHSIFSLPRTNETDGMVNIGRGKLRRMTSRECGEVRMMNRAKLRDGTKANTSRRVYLPNSVASINEGKDVVTLVRGNALHSGLGGEQLMVPWIFI